MNADIPAVVAVVDITEVLPMRTHPDTVGFVVVRGPPQNSMLRNPLKGKVPMVDHAVRSMEVAEVAITMKWEMKGVVIEFLNAEVVVDKAMNPNVKDQDAGIGEPLQMKLLK